MNKFKKITKTTTKDEIVDTICDICHVSEKDWKYLKGGYYEDDVTINHRYGTSYGSDGGSGEEIDLDICPSCFRNNIFPYINSIAKSPIKYKEWDY